MIEVDNLSLHVGAFQLAGISFRVPSGCYAVLMGRTGSGKTTILESIIGLRHVTGGSIRLHGQEVANLKPAARGVGYVPQDGALFATMTVEDQIALGLVIRRFPKDRIRARVNELARLLGITYLLSRKPRGLSGGERQRVALGRALSFYPRVLCLDEPLSALDDDTRGEMIGLLKRVQEESGVTALHVTHNRSEAEKLADVRLQIADGRLWQVAPESKSKSPAPETPSATGSGPT